MDKQAEQWIKHTESISVQDVVDNYNKPKAHQTEFSTIINDICKKNDYQTIIEVGCETGINCMMVNNSLDKCFFDLNPKAIELVQNTCEELKIDGEFVVGDMFKMNFNDEHFDLIFNSGVVEHFVFNERVEFLTEYDRVLRKGGKMVLAYPNHYSFLYRTAYVIFKKLLFGFKWPWPKEYKFYDMKEEIERVGLKLESRTVVARNTFFDGLNNHGILKKGLLFFDKLFNYEGYLVVLIIKKQ